MQFVKGGYHITTDPSFQNERYGITPELSKRMEALILECLENSTPKLIDKLHQLIVKHPSVPQLKNYLATAFQVQGNRAKAMEANEWARSEHPDYLFAKINTANLFIETGEFDKIPALLGENLELQSLYPNRDLFHIGEVTNYFKIAIRYLAAIEDMELAENRLSLLKEIAPDHPDTEQAEIFLWPLRIKMAGIRQEEEDKNRIKPIPQKTALEISNQGPPQFYHAEIQYLYQYDLSIAHDKIREILALPRQTLIEDLEKVLADAVSRYAYFQVSDETEEPLSCVLHAMFLLKEIKAESSLPKVLSFLEYEADFLDFWLGDHNTENLWQCVYVLGASSTAMLKEFLVKPGVFTYAKSAVSEALNQRVLHNPAKREEVLGVYTEVITHLANAKEEDNILDSDFTGLLIGDVIDCNLHELKPIIKTLYDKGYVPLGINGDYDEIEMHFKKNNLELNKRDIKNIFDLYTEVITTWSGYDDPEHDLNDSYDRYFPSYQQPAISDKVGRNDPCPCGSGKKYKKCCLDKNQQSL